MKKIQILLFSAFSAAALHAGSGSPVVIHGDVSASTGKTVTGTKVYVTNVCTNQVTEITPDSAKGAFKFSGDFCGTYIVEVKADGYSSKPQILQPGDQNFFVVNLKLEQLKPAGGESKQIQSSDAAQENRY